MKWAAESRSMAFWVNIYILTSGSHLTHTELLIYCVCRFIFIALPQIYLTQSFSSAQSQFLRVQWKFISLGLDVFARRRPAGMVQGEGCPCS